MIEATGHDLVWQFQARHLTVQNQIMVCQYWSRQACYCNTNEVKPEILTIQMHVQHLAFPSLFLTVPRQWLQSVYHMWKNDSKYARFNSARG